MTSEGTQEALLASIQARAAQIEQIRRLPEQIEYLAGALDPHELTGRFVIGEWSAAQVIHHLADSHVNNYLRCRRVVTEDAPLLQLYDQPRWGALPDAAGVDVTASLELLHGIHARWVQFWATLPEPHWQRTGILPHRGPLTLADMLALYAGHGAAHIDQIRRSVAAQYTAPPATHAELLRRFDREWARLRSLVQRMTPAQLETPFDGGWSPKQHLAHVTGWERYLVVTEIGGAPVAKAFGFVPPMEDGKLLLDALNAQLAAAGALKSPSTVLTEFDAVHAEARAAVAGVDFAAWQGPMHEWYGHYLEHWQWLPIA